MKISRVETIHLSLPTVRARISLTESSPARADLLAVQLHTDAGLVGLGFTSTPFAGKSLRALLESELAPIVVGNDAVDTERLLSRVQARFRHAGWAGLASRAYAAIDIALWDVKAKAAGLPLARLLGGSRTSTSCFAGDLATIGTDAAATVREARPLVDQGVLGVSIEVGSGNVQLDADRVQQIRDGLGESAWIGVAGEGRYDLGTALAMAHFYEEDIGIDWLDFPIPVEDRIGYKRLAERMEAPLAIGSSIDDRDGFVRLLQQGDVRFLRPDPLRLGGITPLIKVAALAEAFHVSVVPYRLPEIGIQLACGLPNVPMVEWGSWLSPAFAEPIVPKQGTLMLPVRQGHGLELSAEAVTRFRVE